MQQKSIEIHAICVGFGDFYLHIRKRRGNFTGKHRNHRIFRGKMPGIDNTQALFISIPESVIFF